MRDFFVLLAVLAVWTVLQRWLLPRFAPPPWAEFVPRSWEVTDPDDLAWMLPRLRPTPVRHFSTPLSLGNPAATRLPRAYVRSTRWPHPGLDRFAGIAEREPGWRLRRLDASHLAYITSPTDLADVLLELVAPVAAEPHEGVTDARHASPWCARPCRRGPRGSRG